jgi:acetyl-CoA C-acetyltransferase
MVHEVVVVDAVRSPIGKRNGGLSHKHVNELLGDVLTGLLRRSELDGSAVDQVIGGCVVQYGMQSSNVTRNAWLTAGLPLEVPGVTVNVQCGSSQEAFTLAHAQVAGGLADVVIACGVESMSQIPIHSAAPLEGPSQPRGGRYAELYEPTSQFEGADRIAEKWGFTRPELEVFGKRSQDLAAQAWAEGRYDSQIIAIEAPVVDVNGEIVGTKLVARDEGLRATTLEGLAALKAVQADRDPVGRHTAGTASQISDGASAALLMTAQKAAELGVRARARVVESVLVGCDPVLMLTGPIPATKLLLQRSGWELGDIDLFEVNEAFAAVVCAWAKETGVDIDRVNVNGGAIAMGHPLGGTGTILVAKMLHELERTGGRRGLISMCCGGGLGTGTLLEVL